jgi:ribosomal protein S18 acetylase RimI-like enzyme
VGHLSNSHGGSDEGDAAGGRLGGPDDLATDGRRLAAGSGVDIRPARRPEVHAALQLILGANGRPAAEEHVVDFLRYAVYRQLDLNDIWVSMRDGRIAWAILPVVSPGKTMLLFSPTHVPHEDQDTAVCPLVERVLEHYQNRAIDLAQVLLDPGDAGAVEMFKACRFEPLAELIYLDRDVRRSVDVATPAGFVFEPYSAAMHAAFARAVSATYQGSLDCPRLNGRRNIDDVLDGHKAAGEFDPKLWFLLRDDTAGAAAGVLLLNRSTRTDSLELVYLGLAPHYRGRRLGDLLMRQAIATAAAIGSRRLSLAVDSMNAPALRLYQRHGMTRLCSRIALLRDLRGSGVGSEALKR